MTRRASRILDLAVAIRLFTGDDIASQFRHASSEKEGKTCPINPSRDSGDRKAGGNGLDGYAIPACLSLQFSLGRYATDFGGGGSH